MLTLLYSVELGAGMSLAMEVVGSRQRRDVRLFCMSMLVGRQKVVRIVAEVVRQG